MLFFHTPHTPEISTLSLHDALPIWERPSPLISRLSTSRPSSTSTPRAVKGGRRRERAVEVNSKAPSITVRSEEHTSELQSQFHLVCRLLLEKKKKIIVSSIICLDLL